MVGFLADKYRIFSGGDDYSSNLWDIPSATEIVSYTEHTDYVRCGCASKLNGDVFITGLILFFMHFFGGEGRELKKKYSKFLIQ